MNIIVVYQSLTQFHHHNQTMELVQSSPSNATYNSANKRLQFNPQLIIQTNYWNLWFDVKWTFNTRMEWIFLFPLPTIN